MDQAEISLKVLVKTLMFETPGMGVEFISLGNKLLSLISFITLSFFL